MKERVCVCVCERERESGRERERERERKGERERLGVIPHRDAKSFHLASKVTLTSTTKVLPFASVFVDTLDSRLE